VLLDILEFFISKVANKKGTNDATRLHTLSFKLMGSLTSSAIVLCGR
jgi:hypothetical protein